MPSGASAPLPETKLAAGNANTSPRDSKFDAGCGWPSFYEPLTPGAVRYIEDTSLGMRRVEVRCATCDSHLGHVFPDAPHTPTGNRFCMNSVSLTFAPNE